MMAEVSLKALMAVEEAAEQLSLQTYLVGALAREVIFDLPVFGDARRQTNDVDAVVEVEGWQQFEQLEAVLLRHGFTKAKEFRYVYWDGTELDLLPYGGVEDSDGNLVWDAPRRISMRGFRSAATDLRIEERNGISFRVVNLPGFLVLKCFAFRDRHGWENKDLSDICLVLESATSLLATDILKYLGSELADLPRFELATPYYLGRKARDLSTPEEATELAEIIRNILEQGTGYRQLLQLGRDKVDERIELLRYFLMGISGDTP
jgi:predicted nucleotidyltransferase